MEEIVSKSKFKPQALKYFRQVQETGRPLIITDRAKPVLKIVPFQDDPMDVARELRNSVRKYESPTEPIAENEWDALK